MNTLKEKIAVVKREFDRSASKVTALNLLKYPEESFGNQLGKFLLGNNYGQNVYASQDDTLQMLIVGKNSLSHQLGLQYYLFGNGSNSLRVMLAMCAALAVRPHLLGYFYKMYRKGKAAHRLYDIDHLGLLHLPLTRIRETFLINQP